MLHRHIREFLYARPGYALDHATGRGGTLLHLALDGAKDIRNNAAGSAGIQGRCA
jgi:hypothetical protein